MVYADGSIDVLEVKSVAPFATPHRGADDLVWLDRGPHTNLATRARAASAFVCLLLLRGAGSCVFSLSQLYRRGSHILL